MRRRWGLIASGVAVVALLLAMSPAESRMQDRGPGMIPFELAGSQARAERILAEWGDDGRAAAKQSLWIDFGFLLACGTFLTLALSSVRALAERRRWRRLAAIGAVVAPFGALAAGFDALENVCLLLTLGDRWAAFPVLATIFAACKFALLAMAIAYLCAGIALRFVSGRPATPAA